MGENFDCDCVMYATNSRDLEGEQAYDRVYEACQKFKAEGCHVYSKRIDSTLRGNLGRETDAMLDCLGNDTVAVVVPCSPDSGRVLAGGCLWVHGKPLHKTEAALDPKTPVLGSEPERLFQEQSHYKAASIFMKDLAGGTEYLADLMKRKAAMGCRILIADAASWEDLNTLSEAVMASGLNVIAVDPGAFTAVLAEKRRNRHEGDNLKKILLLVGSVYSSARQQMEELWTHEHTKGVMVHTQELLASEERSAWEIERVTEAILAEQGRLFTVTGDGILPENRIDLPSCARQRGCSVEALSARINQAFAQIAWNIFQGDSSFSGLYTSGGDITAAVCRKFGAAGIELLDEVLPLAACGRLIAGPLEGIAIVTKGGSQGGIDAIRQCALYLKEIIEQGEEEEYEKTDHCDSHGRPGRGRTGNCGKITGRKNSKRGGK